MTHFTSLMYYLPTKPSITAQYLKGGPEYTVFAKETEAARARTQEYGVNYPKVSQAIWTAIQAAITGTIHRAPHYSRRRPRFRRSRRSAEAETPDSYAPD